jgi:hypothetical protein
MAASISRLHLMDCGLGPSGCTPKEQCVRKVNNLWSNTNDDMEITHTPSSVTLICS